MDNRIVKVGRIILSVLFIFSGISKLLSIQFFDQLVAELLIGKDFMSHYTAFIWVQFLSRLIIAGELMLGAALLQEKLFKKIILPATLLLLVAFTIQLIYSGIEQGDFVTGNCGCFGDVVPMTILESIFKNVFSMVIVGLVWWKYRENAEEQRFRSWVMPTLIGVVSFATISLTVKDYTPKKFVNETVQNVIENTVKEEPEIKNSSTETDSSITESSTDSVLTTTNNIDTVSSANVEKSIKEEPEIKTEPKELTSTEKTKSLLARYTQFSDGSSMNLEKGTTLVCMFSMTCSHCQEVYRNMCEISQYAKDKLPPTFLLNYGRELEQNYFFNQAGECKDAHIRIGDYGEFMTILEGETFPRMLVFKDGEIVKKWDVDSYSKEDFMKYFNIEEKKDDGLNFEKEEDSNGWGLDEEKNPWD